MELSNSGLFLGTTIDAFLNKKVVTEKKKRRMETNTIQVKALFFLFFFKSTGVSFFKFQKKSSYLDNKD